MFKHESMFSKISQSVREMLPSHKQALIDLQEIFAGTLNLDVIECVSTTDLSKILCDGPKDQGYHPEYGVYMTIGGPGSLGRKRAFDLRFKPTGVEDVGVGCLTITGHNRNILINEDDARFIELALWMRAHYPFNHKPHLLKEYPNEV